MPQCVNYIKQSPALFRKHVEFDHPVKDATRVARMCMEKAALDSIRKGHVDAPLLKILADSRCPLVNQLREALCAAWQDQQAGDGEYSGVQPARAAA